MVAAQIRRGHWAWEPLLESINWRSVHYPDLYQPVREALRWWKLDPVRLTTSVRYLGTFACQGGLPLALVGNANSRVIQYLRAVLKHTAAYRQFVDDPIELARDQQHLLRPPTLRRDYVFRLAADLTEAVLNLRDDVQDEDPLGALDRAQPDWRASMPLDLGDARARDLLTGLLREAVRDRATCGDAHRGMHRSFVPDFEMQCQSSPRKLLRSRSCARSPMRFCTSRRNSTDALRGLDHDFGPIFTTVAAR